MDSRLESDIAYIKASVSDVVKHATRCATLESRIERVSDELQTSRSKIRELELFQTAVKTVVIGLIAVSTLLLLCGEIVESSRARAANKASAKPEASQRGHPTPSQPEYPAPER